MQIANKWYSNVNKLLDLDIWNDENEIICTLINYINCPIPL